MARKTHATRQQRELMEFLRLGGTKIPAGFASKAAAATKSMLREKSETRTALRRQGATLFGELQGKSTVAVDDPANKKALDGLLRWHRKLAGKKLPFPTVQAGDWGIFPGTISGTVVPPFDFADSIPTLLANVSNPTLSASANVNGQISASAVTSEKRGFNGGSEYARVGIFFHPTTAGTLTISASPTYSFEWSTNSLNTTLVTSSGDVGLTVYGMDDMAHIVAGANNMYQLWQEDASGEINLDFGFDVHKSLSVSLSVTRSLVYLCFVEVEAHVVGMGWPGSLATAMASATVPSISYRFEPELVVMA
jgi:hypothetical protein